MDSNLNFKRFFLSTILGLVLVSIVVQAQMVQDTSSKYQRISKIYKSLEYPTTAFDDFKQTWVVTDPIFVREIYNRFIVKNALRLEGVKPGLAQLREKSRDIYQGKVFIELRRRYYDDEIELLRFFSESKLSSLDSSDYFFDAVEDFVYIRDVLGTPLYEDLKKQFYAMNDLTKSDYDSKYAYGFDIYMHFLQPELMFWSVTTDNKNKFLLSLIGRWGNDLLCLPGWYYPSYIAGFKVTYIDYLINNRPNNSYILEVGTGVAARQPSLGLDTDDFGKRLYHSGSNLYFKAYGNPLRLIDESLKDFEIRLESLFSLNRFNVGDVGVDYLTKFNTVRNYFLLYVTKKELLNFSDVGSLSAGLGLGSFDIYYYLLNPDLTQLKDLKPSSKGNFKNAVFTEIGVNGEGGLLQYNASTIINYNFTENHGYVGLKMFFMLTNSIGFDFRYFTSYRMSTKALPVYRNENYLVFSPVFRINY